MVLIGAGVADVAGRGGSRDDHHHIVGDIDSITNGTALAASHDRSTGLELATLQTWHHNVQLAVINLAGPHARHLPRLSHGATNRRETEANGGAEASPVSKSGRRVRLSRHGCRQHEFAGETRDGDLRSEWSG